MQNAVYRTLEADFAEMAAEYRQNADTLLRIIIARRQAYTGTLKDLEERANRVAGNLRRSKSAPGWLRRAFEKKKTKRKRRDARLVVSMWQTSAKEHTEIAQGISAFEEKIAPLNAELERMNQYAQVCEVACNMMGRRRNYTQDLHGVVSWKPGYPYQYRPPPPP